MPRRVTVCPARERPSNACPASGLPKKNVRDVQLDGQSDREVANSSNVVPGNEGSAWMIILHGIVENSINVCSIIVCFYVAFMRNRRRSLEILRYWDEKWSRNVAWVKFLFKPLSFERMNKLDKFTQFVRQFVDEVQGGICSSCHASCLTCKGPQFVDCLGCPPATFLHKGKCVVKCPKSTYADNKQVGWCHCLKPHRII